MARVTKINVGGTNYDIAHEGELKNSGFEVVTALPTTGLFAGREVMYNGKKYVYSSGWKEEITANTMYEANLLWGGRNITNGYSPIDSGMMSELSANVMAFPNPAGISIEYSRDGGVTWLDYEATDEQKVNIFTTLTSLYCGKSYPDGLTATVGYQLRITFTPIDCGLYTKLNKIIIDIISTNAGDCWCTFKGLKKREVDAGNEDDIYYRTIVDKARIVGNSGYNVLNFSAIWTAANAATHSNNYYRLRLVFGYDKINYSGELGLYVQRLRFFGQGRYKVPSNLARYNHLYEYDWQQNAFFPKKVQSNEIINFDVNNIEPTQTGSSVSKTSTWLWQYLIQAVNWLKANNVQLSAYNTKVAALEQADSTKLDKRAYNQIYTNSGYVNFSTNVATGALIIELPFAPNSDVNNSMTYIELNVYSHGKGCSKYIIGVYSFSQNSQYDWSVYSYMGYNYFSKISFGRRTDNNNIVIVLGDFTDVHRYEHFSISNIITGFNRNNDDTDGFLLYTDSDSNNYSSLKQSTYNPLNISYDDLTNKPTLATVATSGSYNDLTDKPTFSGSYNDLTDKPTLFSGSYDDLTNKPNLATVATSGSYNDLTNTPTLATVATSGSYNDLIDKPTFSGSYNDLTDKPTLFSGSYDDLTNKPNLAAVATSGSYNDLTDKPAFSGSYNDLTDKPTLFSGSYDDLTDKPNLAAVATSGSYNDLTNTPTIPSSFSDLSGTISSAQIPDGAVGNTQLTNSSMTLNGINCELGDTKTLPCIISFNSTLYKVRIYQNWLQIYHAGTWVNKYYLLSNPPTVCHYITDLSDPSWFDESVTEYELDNSATAQLLNPNSSVNLADWIKDINANQITFNSSVILSKDFSKGALDNIISNLKDNGYSVFVENDIDTILQSGNDWVMSIKIKRFYNIYKAIIECYVAR